MSEEAAAAAEEDSEILPPPKVEGEVPTFFHIGGWAKECLIRGYKIGKWQLEVSTRTKDFTFEAFGESKEKNHVCGEIAARKKFGYLELGQFWQTDKVLGTEISANTKFKNGGSLYSQLIATYGMDSETERKATMDITLDKSPIRLDFIIPVVKEPKLLGYVMVAPHPYWMFGYRMVYDLENRGFDKHALAAGFTNRDTELGIKLENFEDVRGSIFQRINERWAIAMKLNFYNEDGLKYALGGQVKLNNGALLKAKIREDSFLGFVYNTHLSENIEVTYHLGFEAKDPFNGNHRIGVAWNIHT